MQDKDPQLEKEAEDNAKLFNEMILNHELDVFLSSFIPPTPWDNDNDR